MPTSFETTSATSALPLRLYRDMLVIRLAEEKIASVYASEVIRCPIHLGIGHEGSSAVVGVHLAKTDVAYAGHRSHAPYLAKGGNLTAFFAELLGKEGGCAKGYGGSMHLIDTRSGFYGSTSIVAGTIPVATGSALALKRFHPGRIAVCFFGDAAIEEGVFFESLLFASQHRLPILYVLEDNGYSCYTKTRDRRPEIDFASLASSLSVNYHRLDGSRPLESLIGAGEAIADLRENPQPLLLHFEVFRRFEHCGHTTDDHLGYREPGELDLWPKMDPIANTRATLLQRKLATATQLEGLQAKLSRDVERAYQKAFRMKDQTAPVLRSSGRKKP
jgi:TPP-dependent pyruvate/acetoin dehydrogenase alpha subunit